MTFNLGSLRLWTAGMITPSDATEGRITGVITFSDADEGTALGAGGLVGTEGPVVGGVGTRGWSSSIGMSPQDVEVVFGLVAGGVLTLQSARLW